MAGKWHIDAAAYADGTTKALPFGRMVQAYTQGYEGDVVSPSLTDAPGMDAYAKGQADAAAGLDPGFTAEVAPEPPPPEPLKKHKDKGHKK